MADAHTLYKLVNEQPGPRGVWSDGVLSHVEAGQTVFATLSDDDKALADKHGYLTITKATAAEKKAIEGDTSPPVAEPSTPAA